MNIVNIYPIFHSTFGIIVFSISCTDVFSLELLSDVIDFSDGDCPPPNGCLVEDQ